PPTAGTAKPARVSDERPGSDAAALSPGAGMVTSVSVTAAAVGPGLPVGAGTVSVCERAGPESPSGAVRVASGSAAERPGTGETEGAALSLDVADGGSSSA